MASNTSQPNQAQLDETPQGALQALWSYGFDGRNRDLYTELHRRITKVLPENGTPKDNDTLEAIIRRMVLDAQNAKKNVELHSPDYISAYGEAIGMRDGRFSDVVTKKRISDTKRKLLQAGLQIGQTNVPQEPIRSHENARKRLVEAMPIILKAFDDFITDYKRTARAFQDFSESRATLSTIESRQVSAEISGSATEIEENTAHADELQESRDEERTIPEIHTEIKTSLGIEPGEDLTQGKKFHGHYFNRTNVLRRKFSKKEARDRLYVGLFIISLIATLIIDDSIEPSQPVIFILVGIVFIFLGAALLLTFLIRIIAPYWLWHRLRRHRLVVLRATSALLVGSAIMPIASALLISAEIRDQSTENSIQTISNAAIDSASIDVIYPNDFDSNAACPRVKSLPYSLFIPLTSCRSGEGALNATVTSHAPGIIGIYPAGDVSLSLNTDSDSPLTYYIETRFRAIEGTSLSACGVAVEDLNEVPILGQSLFFDVVPSLAAGIGQYSGMVLSKQNGALGSSSLGNSFPDERTLAQLDHLVPRGFSNPEESEGISLPPDALSGGWTELGILISGNRYTYIVDGHVVLADMFSGFRKIDRISLGVSAGNDESNGVATCLFDDFYIRELPDGYRLLYS